MRLQRNQMAEHWMLAYSAAVVEDLDGLETPARPLDSSSRPVSLTVVSGWVVGLGCPGPVTEGDSECIQYEFHSP